MFFPWIGLFEQVKLSDVFVHYDDVQLPQGRSFISRVQIKTKTGVQWLTVPVKRSNNQLISDVELDNAQNWKRNHLRFLQHSYSKASCKSIMLDLVESIYNYNDGKLSNLNQRIVETISSFLHLSPCFKVSSHIDAKGHSSEKLLNIIKNLEGTVYVTGHGARNYLNHELFESENIQVAYMDYKKKIYPQLYGEFTPYVSILDLIANVGYNSSEYLVSATIDWREFLKNE